VQPSINKEFIIISITIFIIIIIVISYILGKVRHNLDALIYLYIQFWQIKSIFGGNRSVCGTSIQVGMGTPLRILV